MKKSTFRVGLLALLVGGCTAASTQCLKPPTETFTYQGTTMRAPEGCRFTQVSSDSIQLISCENGRQGFVIADVTLEMP